MVRSPVKPIDEKKIKFKVSGSLWIECEGERFFGPGRVELLQRIDETGSINKAAKLMRMSYKKAWEMVNDLNTQASKPFVLTHTGGENGGGSVITAEAKKLMAYHQQLRARFLDFLENETRQLKLS